MRETHQRWWSELGKWLQRHQGRADYLYVYDRNRGRLERCFERNVDLQNVDAETIGKLYQAAEEGRLGMLQPNDLKPQLLTADPENIIAPEQKTSVAAVKTTAAEKQEPVQTETSENTADKTEQEAVSDEEKPERAADDKTEQEAVSDEEKPERAAADKTEKKVASVPDEGKPERAAADKTEKKAASVPDEGKPERASADKTEKKAVSEPNKEKPERAAADKRAQETVSVLDEGKPERAAAEPALGERMRHAEEHYRQVVYVPKKGEKPTVTETSTGQNSMVRQRVKQVAALEQAAEMVRNMIPTEEELSDEQRLLVAALAQMMMSIGAEEDEDEDELERERRAREELIAAQNLFIWAAVSDKRDQELFEARMEQLMQMGGETERLEKEWTERLEGMAEELYDMDMVGANEDDCKEKIRGYLNGQKPARHEERAKQSEETMEHHISKEMWGNALRHFCRFAASEVPLSIRHIQVAEHCRRILWRTSKMGISMDDLGLDAQEKTVVQGTIEMGALVEKGLLAQAALTSGQRLSGAQYRTCLRSYLAMKGIEETLIPHVQAYQKEISTGDGPVSALQILMANRGFHANDLRAKAGRTSVMSRLERMDPMKVARMIREGSGEIAEMGRQVMIASCQMGEVPEPVREPKVPQKGGPML